MIRRRDTPDGLPYRVYERKGVRTYSIGYKLATGAWAFRYSCPVDDVEQRQKLRREAVERAESCLLQAPAPAAEPRRVGPDLSHFFDPVKIRAREEEGRRRLAEVRAWKTANPEPLPPGEAERRKESRAALVRHHAAKRRSVKLQRTPPWADMDAIRAVYEQARKLTVETGRPHHVDHIIPLQGELVSGLHVHGNLRAIPWLDNIKKGNRVEEET